MNGDARVMVITMAGDVVPARQSAVRGNHTKMANAGSLLVGTFQCAAPHESAGRIRVESQSRRELTSG